MSQYKNELEDYLYNHNYISNNKKSNYQQELSIERAECIIYKHDSIMKKEKEELKKYYCKRNDCGGRLKENNKLTDSEVLTEFERWLENKLTTTYAKNDMAKGYKNALSIALNKLQELKGKNDR